MKQFWYQNKTYDKIPDPLPIPGGQISPVREADFIRYGGEIIVVITPLELEFLEACKGFRAICYRVRPIVGDPNWKGGIEEIRETLKDPRVVSHPDFQFISTMLTWYDKECTYLGGKIGLGQPAWFHECWKHADEDIEMSNPYEEELNPYDTPYDE